MNELTNKFAIITGGTGGIGAATAITFAKEGAKGIIVAALDVKKSVAVIEKIKNTADCNCIFVKTDISNYKEIKNLFEIVLKTFNTLDILVNCAGICTVESLEDIGEKEWDKVMNINLRGTYLCSKEAIKIMKAKKYGKIVNVSSISGRIGGIVTGINYITSKGGIISLTMSLAKVCGPYNINVNCVAPGFIYTEMTKNFKHFNVETVPLRRIGTPEDVSDVIMFLASERSKYITGATIDVNGGVFMG